MRFVSAVCILIAFGFEACAETKVSEHLRFRLSNETVYIGPGETGEDTYNLDRGDLVEVTIELSQDSVPGIGAVICPAAEYKKYRAGYAARFCSGFSKSDFGASFSYEALTSGPHVFAIDNSFASFFGKTVTYESHITTRIDPVLRGGYQASLDELYAVLSGTFEFDPFDISIAPCGDVNAFSEKSGGHITLCSELVLEAGRLVHPNVIKGILAHELGHTLLNLWGLPNWQNEQTADEFSAVLMLLAGDAAAAEDYVEYFSNSNTQHEAAIAEAFDSPHPLSIQRMRNISHILDQPDEYITRWLPILYENMTETALQLEIGQPNPYTDLALARKILEKKQSQLD